MIARGFRFGLLLQFAIGPVCLYVLSVSTTIVFLGALSFAASSARRLLTHNIIFTMNLIVGAVLLVFAIRMLFQQGPDTVSAVE